MSVTFSRGENPLRADKLNQAFADRVLRGGDTMQGPLMLSRPPQVAFEAATKQYVDAYNQLGPAGPAGPPGATGPQGPAGADGATYTLPTASTTVLGGVKVDGTTVTISSGVISSAAGYTLPTASTTVLGGVKIDGTTITIAGGVISSAGGYTLPTATTTVLGGVKIDGTTVTIAGGVISSSAVASLGFTPYNATNPSGYITAASIPSSLPPSGAASGDLTGTYPAPTLTTTGVGSGSYTYASITVDAKGRLSVASSGTAPPVVNTVTTPLMNGAAAIGALTTYARPDHVHPTDTTRYAASNPSGYISGNQTVTLSGDVTGSGATAITTALATSGVTAGSYTNSNITVDAKGRVTVAASGTAGSTVTVADIAPTLTSGALWFDSVASQLYVGYNDGTSTQWVIANNLFASAGPITYSQLPPEVQQLPISFPFSGKPATGAVVNVPMAFAVTVPATLAGSVVYDTTKSTGSPVFTLNKISSGTTTALGTVTITSTSNTSCTLAGAGGSLAVGDVMQMVAPTQDATLADVGITVLAARV